MGRGRDPGLQGGSCRAISVPGSFAALSQIGVGVARGFVPPRQPALDSPPAPTGEGRITLGNSREVRSLQPRAWGTQGLT